MLLPVTIHSSKDGTNYFTTNFCIYTITLVSCWISAIIVLLLLLLLVSALLLLLLLFVSALLLLLRCCYY